MPAAVTLVGWLIFAKSLLFLFSAPEALSEVFARTQYGQHLYVSRTRTCDPPIFDLGRPLVEPISMIRLFLLQNVYMRMAGGR